jgi:hypothetical protein
LPRENLNLCGAKLDNIPFIPLLVAALEASGEEIYHSKKYIVV